MINFITLDFVFKTCLKIIFPEFILLCKYSSDLSLNVCDLLSNFIALRLHIILTFFNCFHFFSKCFNLIVQFINQLFHLFQFWILTVFCLVEFLNFRFYFTEALSLRNHLLQFLYIFNNLFLLLIGHRTCIDFIVEFFYCDFYLFLS